MFTFNQKIILTYCLVFLFFFILLFPFVPKSVEMILKDRMLRISSEMIEKAQSADDQEQMISFLRNEEFNVVFRVSLLNDQGNTLYDSHLERLVGRKKTIGRPLLSPTHPEVAEAIKKGRAFSEGYSTLFSESYIYLAQSFTFQGSEYIMRMAFPSDLMHAVTRRFELGFYVLATVVLLLFATMTCFILNRLTWPIRKIIETIKSYKKNALPYIQLGKNYENNEFQALAQTINSLNKRIQEKIDLITEQGKETRSVLESLEEGVISTDDTLHVKFVNFMALQTFQLKRADVTKKSVYTVIDQLPKEIKKTLNTLIKECLHFGKPVHHLLQMDKNHFVELLVSPKYKKSGIIIVVQNKTVENQVLEMSKQFAAQASHELKTPITVIQGFAEMLHENPSLEPKKVAQITEKIMSGCERMDHLIRTLLSLSEIDHLPTKKLNSTNIVDIVKKAEIEILQAYPNVSITFAGDQEKYNVKIDQDLITQVFFNLFENAIKYTKKSPKIEVSFSRKEGFIHVAVKDNGVGIPQAKQEHIFGRFVTLDKDKAKQSGGVGLGLAIVKSILDKHRASIRVTSKPQAGSTFTVIFPTAS